MFVTIGRKRLMLVATVLAIVLVVCAVFIPLRAGAVEASVSDWGLSFQEEGKTPVGNAGGEYLLQYDAYYAGDAGQKTIYLTFDAGYENGYTPAILDTLKKHNVKAAFFVVGNYMETCPELIQRMVKEGHIVGNHTYSHPDMSQIADLQSFQQELQKNETLYQEITGREMPKYYRPPQGKFSESNLSMAKELGYHTVFWSLAYVDWYVDQQPTHEEAISKLTSRIHPGAVVLLHSTSQTNAEVLDTLLTLWEKEGYTFGTLDLLCQ